MGAAQSVPHFAHSKSKPGHRFRRVEGKDLDKQVRCEMCREMVGKGAAAYQCQRCPSFFLDDVCFHRQEKIGSHWAHLVQPSHPLTLSDNHNIAGRSCTLCAGDFTLAVGAFVYGCRDQTDCHGFYAHPSCCLDLSRTLTTDLHDHELTLLQPPPHAGGRRRSSCLNPNCRNRSSRRSAWSYQCPRCNVYLCLACRVEGGGGGGARPGSRRRCERVIEVFGCMGDAMGTFVNRFACACIGNPATT